MRDPGLRDHGAELQVGALVLISALILVVGLFWISDTRFGGPELRVVGIAADAGQVTTDSRVFLRGVDVGSVEAVSLEARRVVIRVAVFADVELPADTRGVIKPAGFLGAQMIELVPGVATAALATGDTIPLGRTADLMTLASELGDETNVLLDRVTAVLSERMVADLQQSSRAFASAMGELETLLAGERETIHGLLASLESAASELDALAGSPRVERSMANLDTLTARLAAASSSFDSTSASLATITGRLAAGEGTLGRLMTEEDLYDQLTETLANLQAASEEVALLVKDVRERPDRYLKDIKISVF
ncbi:MAG: MlaD family protein [Gemmatimonadota bacterium]|nr:MlaD family protein [Gemmatimonadota bacterium]